MCDIGLVINAKLGYIVFLVYVQVWVTVMVVGKISPVINAKLGYMSFCSAIIPLWSISLNYFVGNYQRRELFITH